MKTAPGGSWWRIAGERGLIRRLRPAREAGS